MTSRYTFCVRIPSETEIKAFKLEATITVYPSQHMEIYELYERIAECSPDDRLLLNGNTEQNALTLGLWLSLHTLCTILYFGTNYQPRALVFDRAAHRKALEEAKDKLNQDRL